MEEGDGLADGEINFDDCLPRAERLIRALKLVPLRELWVYLNSLEEADHLFACDAKCHIGPTPYGGCSHPKKTFLSTRNSRRSTHVYLFWFFVFGNPARITDNMLKGDMRKNLRPICSYGLNECNGHARNPGHQVCINPFHYQVVEPQLIVDKLVQHGVLSHSFSMKTRLVSVRSFSSDLRAMLPRVAHETEAFVVPTDDTASDVTGPVVPAISHPHPLPAPHASPRTHHSHTHAAAASTYSMSPGPAPAPAPGSSASPPHALPLNVSRSAAGSPGSMHGRALVRTGGKRGTQTLLPPATALPHTVHAQAQAHTSPRHPHSLPAPAAAPTAAAAMYGLMSSDHSKHEAWPTFAMPGLQPLYLSSPFAPPRPAMLAYPYAFSSTAPHHVVAPDNEAVVPSDDDTLVDDLDAQEMASILMSIGTRAVKRPRPASGRLSRTSSSCGLQALATAAAAADPRRP